MLLQLQLRRRFAGRTKIARSLRPVGRFCPFLHSNLVFIERRDEITEAEWASTSSSRREDQPEHLDVKQLFTASLTRPKCENRTTPPLKATYWSQSGIAPPGDDGQLSRRDRSFSSEVDGAARIAAERGRTRL